MEEFVLPVMLMAYGWETYCAVDTAASAHSGRNVWSILILAIRKVLWDLRW